MLISFSGGRRFQRWTATPALLIGILLVVSSPAIADSFDDLRLKWHSILTGGEELDLADPGIVTRVNSIANTANSRWNSMIKTNGRSYLWVDASRTNQSEDITSSYLRLKEMALGWALRGSSLYSNATLAADIIGGLEWMYANRYNENKTKYDNWWDWEIGSPMWLNDCMVLMNPALTGSQITNYCKAIDKFTPAVTLTGANRIWKADVVAVRGAVGRNAGKLASARDGLSDAANGGTSSVFKDVTSGDGFYVDGSFIQHNRHPYTGGYGISHFHDSIKLMYWLEGSPWAITDPMRTNVYNWCFDSYEPLIYRGAIPAFVRGREIARQSSSGDYGPGRSAINGMLQLAQAAPPAEALRLKRAIKYWAQTDTLAALPNYVPLHLVGAAKALLAEPAVAPRGELIGHYGFPSMDRVMHLRPGFGFGLAMFSSRIYNYESINTENLKGWYTADGTTWLFNDDLTHFTDAYWPTVDPYHLPGTTVETIARANSWGQSKNTTERWVGGCVLEGQFGAAGMAFKAIDTTSTLSLKKSWFMFDDEVVCLGAGITASGANAVHTTVENRRLNAAGNNGFVAGGASEPVTLGWSSNYAGLNWCTIEGAGGYYFPGGATVEARRYARTGRWYDINILPQPTATLTNPITRNYFSLILNHGAAPTNKTYSYVLLPNQGPGATAAYAGDPHITIVENSTRAQAVRENRLGLLAVNFWGATPAAVDWVACSSGASVLTRESDAGLVVAVSDPTQTNGTINLDLDRAAVQYVEADPAITVNRLSPTIQLQFNATGKRGKSGSIRFLYATNEPPVVEPIPEQAAVAGQAFSLQVLATDPAVFPQELRYSLVSAPAGATIDPLTGLISWIPAPDLLGTPQQFTVTVAEAGYQAKLEPVADAFVRDGSYAAVNYGSDASLVVKLSTSGLTRESFLRFAVPALPGAWQTARLTLTPATANVPGVHGIAVVGDNSWEETAITWNSRPSSGSALTTWTPQAGVPVEIDLPAPGQAAAGGSGLMSLRVFATNSTSDGYVSYGSSEGATTQAPLLHLTAVEPNPLISTQSFSVWVVPSNQPPVLAPLVDRLAWPGISVQVTNSAVDPDLPAQQLRFRLVSAPAGARINAETGVVTWVPSIADLGTTNTFAVAVEEAGWTTRMTPAADAYVRDGSWSGVNFGAETNLAVKAGGLGLNRESYMRFDLPEMPGLLARAELQLTALSANAPGAHALLMLDDYSWSEDALTWNNRPGTGELVTTWMPEAGETRTLDCFDVARETLKSGRNLSLRVFATNSTTDGLVNYASRENAAGPRLELVSTNFFADAATNVFRVVVAAPEVPRVTTVVNGGGIELRIEGDRRLHYTVQGNTNLANGSGWVTLLTTNPVVMPMLWAEPEPQRYTQRFYRVSVTP